MALGRMLVCAVRDAEFDEGLALEAFVAVVLGVVGPLAAGQFRTSDDGAATAAGMPPLPTFGASSAAPSNTARALRHLQRPKRDAGALKPSDMPTSEAQSAQLSRKAAQCN